MAYISCMLYTLFIHIIRCLLSNFWHSIMWITRVIFKNDSKVSESISDWSGGFVLGVACSDAHLRHDPTTQHCGTFLPKASNFSMTLRKIVLGLVKLN